MMSPVGAYLGSPCVPEMDFSGVVQDLIGSKAASLFEPGIY